MDRNEMERIFRLRLSTQLEDDQRRREEEIQSILEERNRVANLRTLGERAGDTNYQKCGGGYRVLRKKPSS